MEDNASNYNRSYWRDSGPVVVVGAIIALLFFVFWASGAFTAEAQLPSGKLETMDRQIQAQKEIADELRRIRIVLEKIERKMD